MRLVNESGLHMFAVDVPNNILQIVSVKNFPFPVNNETDDCRESLEYPYIFWRMRWLKGFN